MLAHIRTGGGIGLLILMTVAAVLVSFLGGVAAGQRTKADPRLYWGFLGAGLVLTTALMFGGYTWYDEMFVAGLLLADPLGRTTRTAASRNSPRPGARWALFSLFCLYAVIEGVRGLLFFAGADGGAQQKIRWLAFFVLLLLAAIKGKQLWERGVRPKGAARTITVAGLIFTMLYGAISLYAFITVGTFAGSQFAQRANAQINPFVEIFGTASYVTVIVLYLALAPWGLTDSLTSVNDDESEQAATDAESLQLMGRDRSE